jgi:hypothetical protein
LLTFLGCKNTSKIRNPRGPTCQLLVAAFCFQHYRCCVLLLHTTSNLFLSPSVSPFAIEQRSAELRHDRQTLHLCHRVVVSSELPTPPLIPRVPHCPSSSTTSASIFIDVGRCSAAALTTLNLPGRASHHEQHHRSRRWVPATLSLLSELHQMTSLLTTMEVFAEAAPILNRRRCPALALL